jgi:membrane-associated phospholipid phosphatase
LRYHYFLDVIAGFALAGLGGWIARRRAGVELTSARHSLSP